MALLDNFVSTLSAYLWLTVIALCLPFLAATLLWIDQRKNRDCGAALYVGFATYLGGIPVPASMVPESVFARAVMIVNRVFGLFAFGYLIAAFVVALNQPGRLP